MCCLAIAAAAAALIAAAADQPAAARASCSGGQPTRGGTHLLERLEQRFLRSLRDPCSFLPSRRADLVVVGSMATAGDVRFSSGLKLEARWESQIYITTNSRFLA